MQGMSLQDTLNIEDCILVKGQCRDQYHKYIYHLILLFKNKIIEGSLLESLSIQKQIAHALLNTPTLKISLSQLLEAELLLCSVELYAKRKQKKQYLFHLAKLKLKLNSLSQLEKQYIRVKVNSLILFDHQLDVFEGLFEHPDQLAIKYYKERKFQEAALTLEKSIKNYPEDDFNIMRKVLIGKILLQKQDLSGFSWLNSVIQTKFNCIIQKYEAKLTFICAYKILIVDKGKNSELTTIHSLQKVLDICFNYIENTNFKQIAKHHEIFEGYKSNIKGSIDERVQYIDKALAKLEQLNCFPGVSIEQLDLRIQLAQYLYQQEEFNRCLDETQRSKTLASQLDIYYWQRELRLSKLSALSYMRLGYYESVIEILDRVMSIEPDRVERVKCLQWKLQADKCRTEESTAIQESETFTPKRINAGSRSTKSHKSSLVSQKTSNRTIETIRKEKQKLKQKQKEKEKQKEKQKQKSREKQKGNQKNEDQKENDTVPQNQKEEIKSLKKQSLKQQQQIEETQPLHNIVSQPSSIDLTKQLKKIKHSSPQSYQFKFKNREEIRESLRISLDEEPKCCLLF